MESTLLTGGQTSPGSTGKVKPSNSDGEQFSHFGKLKHYLSPGSSSILVELTDISASGVGLREQQRDGGGGKKKWTKSAIDEILGAAQKLTEAVLQQRPKIRALTRCHLHYTYTLLALHARSARRAVGDNKTRSTMSESDGGG